MCVRVCVCVCVCVCVYTHVCVFEVFIYRLICSTCSILKVHPKQTHSSCIPRQRAARCPEGSLEPATKRRPGLGPPEELPKLTEGPAQQALLGEQPQGQHSLSFSVSLPTDLQREVYMARSTEGSVHDPEDFLTHLRKKDRL